MTELAGKTGMVMVSATDITGCKDWTLDYTVDMLDTTDFADGAATNAARTFQPGLSNWSGSFSGYKDGAPLALGFSSAIALILEEDTAGTQWTGSAFITGIHASVSVDGIIAYTYDFQGTGALTEAAA